jgi:hypothetical protein
MRPDPGLALQEAVIAGMTAEARGRVRLRLAARGKLLAWQQVDAMAPATELERAELLLRRLYPGLPEPTVQRFLAQLAEAEEAGTWQGFQRPEPLEVR